MLSFVESALSMFPNLASCERVGMVVSSKLFIFLKALSVAVQRVHEQTLLAHSCIVSSAGA